MEIMPEIPPNTQDSLQKQAAPIVMERPSTDPQRKHSSVWVQCESCKSWRRLPKGLHEEVGGEDFWYCSQNPDANYNSCSVPQEMSDEAIDQELEQGSEEDEGYKIPKPRKQKPAVWQHISSNIYTHRQRKVDAEDDIMICTCPRPADGGVGCGVDCLNRRLAVECHPDWCPCGDQCSNQMFAQQSYAKINQRRAGAKGFGLFTRENLYAGQFIIEYIGEVLEEDEYHRRKGFYLESAQRHYYFMNVGNGEVIDACRRGALGRFINHSCEPNCETQKWLVHGELAIGLFATKDVPANTELTFDYNFERYGDKPLKCLCGSVKCRGFIGGKEVANIADDPRGVDEPMDASEEPEPIMVDESEHDDLVAAILDANVGLREADTRRLNKLAGRRGISKDWNTDSGSEGEEEPEEVAETGSKGSMNRPSGASSKAQSDAETEHSTQRRWRLPQTGKAEVRRLLEGRKRLSNGASYSRQEQSDLQRVKSSLLDGQAASKKRVRPTSGRDRESSPSTSTAHRSQDRAARRAFLHEGGADSKPYRPVRAVARQRTQQGSEPVKEKRRSEVDRRLDSLINQSSRALRQVNRNTVLKLLRLFNLCDLGTNSADKDKAKQAHGSSRRTARPRTVQNAVDQSQAVAASPFSREERQANSSSASGRKHSSSPRAGPTDPKPASSQGKSESKPDGINSPAIEPKPSTRQASQDMSTIKAEPVSTVKVDSVPTDADAASVKAETVDVKAEARHESGEIDMPQKGTGRGVDQGRVGVALQSGPGLTVKVKLEAEEQAAGSSPVTRPQEQRLRDRDAWNSPRTQQRASGISSRRRRSRSRSRDRVRRNSGSPYSRGTDTEDGEVKEPSSPARPGELSARQNARLADLSLLLDVILKTDYARAPEEFVKWGTLRQLHTMLSRCIGPHILVFDLVIRKMLEVVKALPFTADDVHHTRNAHGTFADTLFDLADKRKAAKPKTDKSTPALTTAALELLAHFPSDKCKVPVERTYKLRSPRGGRSLRSPGRNSARGSDRGSRVYRGGMPPGRAATGRIVDWKPPGKETPQKPAGAETQARHLSKDTKVPEPTPAPTAKKVSPDATKARPSPQIMRATYVQPKPDATPSRAPPGTPHHAVPGQPYTTPGGRPGMFTPAAAPPPSVGRSQSFAAGQPEAGFPHTYGTPSGARSLHRLHAVRGPGSPPLAPSPAAPAGALHADSRWAPLPPDTQGPSPSVRLPQPPAGPPPSKTLPQSPAGPPPSTSYSPAVASSARRLPPAIGYCHNGSYVPVQASGVIQPQQVPSSAAVGATNDDASANPPLPSGPAGPLSPDPPLPLSPPPKQPLPPPPQRPSADSKPPVKDFGLPPHLLDFLPSPSLPAPSADSKALVKDFGFPPHLSDLHPKKRKREEAGLDEEVKSTDVSLDEGEIPADIAAPKQQDAMSGDSHQQAAAAEAAAAEHGRQQASHDKLSQQAVGDDPGTQPVPVRQTSINGSIAAGVAGLAEGHQHTTTPNGVAPSGAESFPNDWPDVNMTKNDSFMSFVDFAVKQALEPYRTAEGHGGVQLSTERYEAIYSKCKEKTVLAEEQAARNRQAKRQPGQIVRHKVQTAVSSLVLAYCRPISQNQNQKHRHERTS